MSCLVGAYTIYIDLDQKEQPCQSLHYLYLLGPDQYKPSCQSFHHLYLLGSEGAVWPELTIFVFTWVRRSNLVRAYTICIYLNQNEQSCQSLYYTEGLKKNAPFYILCLFHMIDLWMFSLSCFNLMQNGP